MSQGWRTIAEAKKAAQQTAIPKEWILPNTPSQDVLDIMHVPETCGLLSQAELTITNSNVDILLARLASGEWSSVSVTSAFYKRAIIAHQLTNCLTEIFVDRALTRAAELDRRLKETGRTVGPLHGLPVSLKDQINIQGLESCMGYVSWVGQYAERNAVLVDILENAGAVPFVKTNIPQTLMWPETFNHVFGRTVNPHNRSLTSGGSSGGEGALVALKGSPIGVGSDIGGSIRIPSGFCGLYGLRPSYGRVPYAGCVNSLEGQDSVLSVLGPLSNSISGVKNFLKAVIDAKPWLKDPLAVRKRWSDDEYNLADHGFGKKLCFAILWDDGLIRPHPPILRGLEMVKRALQVAGHQVIDWKAHRHEEMCACMRGIWGSGAEEDYRVVTAVTGEPVISSMGLEEDGVASDTDFRPTEGISAYQLWQIQRKKRDLRQEYLNQWEATVTGTGTGRPIDAIISPVAPYAAPPHGMNKGANYTMVWNLLDYSALVIPVSKVDEQVDVQRPPHKFHSDVDQANYQFYDPKTFKNAPICVQVVGRTLEEEAVIAMSEIIDEALKAAPAIAEL